MRRLLTGHAVRYNRRHQRQGHHFQNRYKSILCQEETYLLELVRYIHLNPLRARLVSDLDQLEQYPFSGHGVIMGKQERPWQSSEELLRYFGKKTSSARRNYREFAGKGIHMGRRDDLTGGGLIRSAGGWTAVKELQKSKVHVKSDERILGDGDFVSEILSQAEESFERRYPLKTRVIDLAFVAKRVSALLDIPEDEIWREGKFKHLVRDRSFILFLGGT